MSCADRNNTALTEKRIVTVTIHGHYHVLTYISLMQLNSVHVLGLLFLAFLVDVTQYVSRYFRIMSRRYVHRIKHCQLTSSRSSPSPS